MGKKLVAFVLLGIVSFLAAMSIFASHLATWEIRGQFGDTFGAIFNGLALFALIYTVWMQREELGLQRSQMKESQQELVAQTKVMRAQFHASVAQVRVTRLELLARAEQLEGTGTHKKPEGAAKIRDFAKEVDEHARNLQQQVLD